MFSDSHLLNASGATPGGLDEDVHAQPTADLAESGDVTVSRPGPGAWLRAVLAIGVVAATTLALHLSGVLASTSATFEVMGFDPERARLIADLVGAAIATAAGALLIGAPGASILAGTIGGLALFGRTF